MALKLEKKTHLRKSTEIPTSSLGDIVFLLLIFFLVTTSMNPDKGLGLTLPPPGEEDVKLDKSRIMTVFVNAQGKILVGESEIKLSEVNSKVKERVKENPEVIVSLVTDLNAEYGAMADVLDEIKIAFEELKKENPDFKERISLATPHF